jgi:glycosyltransferase involved in cell wall biosynthesis
MRSITNHVRDCRRDPERSDSADGVSEIPHLDGVPSRGPISCSVIIPCFNEAGTIGECVRRVLTLPEVNSIVVVDDGSTDGSHEVCTSLARRYAPRVTSVLLSENGGKNTAVHAGALHTSADVLIIFDADLTIDPLYVREVVFHFRHDLNTFVFGARSGTLAGAMAPIRRVGNRVFAVWVSILVRRRIADAFCGLKAMPRSTLLATEPSGCRWGDLDLIFAAANQGLRFVALPVEYRPRPSGASKMKLLRSASTFGAICLRRTLQSMRRALPGRGGHPA